MYDIFLIIVISLCICVGMLVGYILGVNRGFKIGCGFNDLQSDADYNAGFIDGMNAANEF